MLKRAGSADGSTPSNSRGVHSANARLGGLLVALVLALALLGPWVAPHDPATILASGLLDDGTPAPPGALWLGADSLGRDFLSRLLHGGSMSLRVALVGTGVAVFAGLTVGLVAGSRGGLLDRWLMQAADVVNSLPFLLVAITIERAFARPHWLTLALLLGGLSWTGVARTTRTRVLETTSLDYVIAARGLGLSEWRVRWVHIAPNVAGVVVALGTLLVGQMVLAESAMSFLGVGVQPPHATWGGLLRDGQDAFRTAPRLLLAPGALIAATVFGFNLLGEGLRDALDPKR